jgi:uncharacterized membrane protein
MKIRLRDAHSRSFAKAVSWRITGSVDTFILSFIITGSFKFAGSIAITEVVTKIVLYYFHERIWSWVSWGKVLINPAEIAVGTAGAGETNR